MTPFYNHCPLSLNRTIRNNQKWRPEISLRGGGYLNTIDYLSESNQQSVYPPLLLHQGNEKIYSSDNGIKVLLLIVVI